MNQVPRRPAHGLGQLVVQRGGVPRGQRRTTLKVAVYVTRWSETEGILVRIATQIPRHSCLRVAAKKLKITAEQFSEARHETSLLDLRVRLTRLFSTRQRTVFA
jgi:hypothetical protein